MILANEEANNSRHNAMRVFNKAMTIKKSHLEANICDKGRDKARVITLYPFLEYEAVNVNKYIVMHKDSGLSVRNHRSKPNYLI